MKRFEYRNLIGLFSSLFFCIFLFITIASHQKYWKRSTILLPTHRRQRRRRAASSVSVYIEYACVVCVYYYYLWLNYDCLWRKGSHTHADMVDERWSTEHSSPNLSSSRIFSWNACRSDLNRSRGRAVISRLWDIQVRQISSREWKLTLNVLRNYQ